MDIFNQEFRSILWLSIRVSGTAVVISSVVGIPLGAWLGLSTGRLQPLWKTLVHTGMAMPPVFVGLLIYMLISHSGPLGWMGWVYTPRAMIAAQMILSLPFVVGITMAAVTSVPSELIVQLRSLGATQRQLRWTVLWEARSGLVLAIAAAFGRSISEVGAVMIVGGGGIHGHTQVLTTAIVEKTSQGQFQLAIALGLVLLSLAVSVNTLILFLQPNSTHAAGQGGRGSSAG